MERLLAPEPKSGDYLLHLGFSSLTRTLYPVYIVERDTHFLRFESRVTNFSFSAQKSKLCFSTAIEVHNPNPLESSRNCHERGFGNLYRRLGLSSGARRGEFV